MNQTIETRATAGGALPSRNRMLRRKSGAWCVEFLLLASLLFASSVALAGVSVKPITWDVVGLNHNRPLSLGPELFPVAARICNEDSTLLESLEVRMI